MIAVDTRYQPLGRLLNLIDPPYREACKSILKDKRGLKETTSGSTHNHQTWPGGYIDHVTDGYVTFQNKSPRVLSRLKVFMELIGGSRVEFGGRRAYGGYYLDYKDPPSGWYPMPPTRDAHSEPFEPLEVLGDESYPYGFLWPTIDDVEVLEFEWAQECGFGFNKGVPLEVEGRKGGPRKT